MDILNLSSLNRQNLILSYRSATVNVKKFEGMCFLNCFRKQISNEKS